MRYDCIACGLWWVNSLNLSAGCPRCRSRAVVVDWSANDVAEWRSLVKSLLTGTDKTNKCKELDNETNRVCRL